MDNDELELEDVLEDEDNDAGDESDDQGDDQAAEPDKPDPKDKRINDLMSKWQQAEARAKAAEGKLPKTEGADGGADTGGDQPSEVQQWVEMVREQAREQVFGSDPRFAEYGLGRNLISGATPVQMQESAKSMSELLDAIETKVQAKVLKRHGLSPAVKSSGAPRARSFADMSDEEFEKTLARAKANF